jgi:hypothetical protein
LPKRFILFVSAALLGLVLTAPSFAASHVIFQKGNKTTTSVNVLVGLAPGHAYKIEITSPSKHPYLVSGFQDYRYVANKMLHSSTKGVKRKGRTPASFVLTQPHVPSLDQWILGADISVTKGHGVIVRVVDLGIRH